MLKRLLKFLPNQLSNNSTSKTRLQITKHKGRFCFSISVIRYIHVIQSWGLKITITVFYCIRNPNPPSPRQPVSISNIFKFHSPFCSFPKKTTLYVLERLHSSSTPTYSTSSLFIIHSPMIKFSPKHVVRQYNHRIASTSDVKLFHISVTQLFQDIALNGASLFLEQTLYDQNHKTTNNWRKNKTKSSEQLDL